MELTIAKHIPFEWCDLYGISDVHLGSYDCDEDLFAADIAAIEKNEKARVIINGDILEYTIKKSKGDIYYQTLSPSQQKKKMKEYLTPIADKIICMVGGNHDELRTEEDAQPIQDIAELLGVPYCQGEACVKIPVGFKTKNGKPAVYTVYATHGWTAARLIGAKAINLDRLKDVVLADLYVISHTHTPHVHKDLYHVPDLYNNNVREIVRHFVNTGSYQKRGQYPIRKGLPAQVLGTPLIKLDGMVKKITVEM